MTEQDYLHQQLSSLRESYNQAAKPIIDRLVYLKNLERPSIVVPMALAIELAKIKEVLHD